MAKIKICGLKRLDDIEIINKYKPDYVGFVFADSKRNTIFILKIRSIFVINSNFFIKPKI